MNSKFIELTSLERNCRRILILLDDIKEVNEMEGATLIVTHTRVDIFNRHIVFGELVRESYDEVIGKIDAACEEWKNRFWKGSVKNENI